eukprot:COSAG02_NODE_5126_length_4608_cov_113.503659_2_plen_890_part_00
MSEAKYGQGSGVAATVENPVSSNVLTLQEWDDASSHLTEDLPADLVADKPRRSCWGRCWRCRCKCCCVCVCALVCVFLYVAFSKGLFGDCTLLCEADGSSCNRHGECESHYCGQTCTEQDWCHYECAPAPPPCPPPWQGNPACWDPTYTYDACCNVDPSTGLPQAPGDAGCWTAELTYATCLCADPTSAPAPTCGGASSGGGDGNLTATSSPPPSPVQLGCYLVVAIGCWCACLRTCRSGDEVVEGAMHMNGGGADPSEQAHTKKHRGRWVRVNQSYCFKLLRMCSICLLSLLIAIFGFALLTNLEMIPDLGPPSDNNATAPPTQNNTKTPPPPPPTPAPTRFRAHSDQDPNGPCAPGMFLSDDDAVCCPEDFGELQLGTYRTSNQWEACLVCQGPGTETYYKIDGNCTVCGEGSPELSIAIWLICSIAVVIGAGVYVVRELKDNFDPKAAFKKGMQQFEKAKKGMQQFEKAVGTLDSFTAFAYWLGQVQRIVLMFTNFPHLEWPAWVIASAAFLRGYVQVDFIERLPFECLAKLSALDTVTLRIWCTTLALPFAAAFVAAGMQVARMRYHAQQIAPDIFYERWKETVLFLHTLFYFKIADAGTRTLLNRSSVSSLELMILGFVLTVILGLGLLLLHRPNWIGMLTMLRTLLAQVVLHLAHEFGCEHGATNCGSGNVGSADLSTPLNYTDQKPWLPSASWAQMPARSCGSSDTISTNSSEAGAYVNCINDPTCLFVGKTGGAWTTCLTNGSETMSHIDIPDDYIMYEKPVEAEAAEDDTSTNAKVYLVSMTLVSLAFSVVGQLLQDDGDAFKTLCVGSSSEFLTYALGAFAPSWASATVAVQIVFTYTVCSQMYRQRYPSNADPVPKAGIDTEGQDYIVRAAIRRLDRA